MTADSDTIGDFANPKLVEAGIKTWGAYFAAQHEKMKARLGELEQATPQDEEASPAR